VEKAPTAQVRGRRQNRRTAEQKFSSGEPRDSGQGVRPTGGGKAGGKQTLKKQGVTGRGPREREDNGQSIDNHGDGAQWGRKRDTLSGSNPHWVWGRQDKKRNVGEKEKYLGKGGGELTRGNRTPQEDELDPWDRKKNEDLHRISPTTGKKREGRLVILLTNVGESQPRSRARLRITRRLGEKMGTGTY